MKNRVVVTIAGQEFALLADREEDYVLRVAARVDEEIMSIAARSNASSAHIAVLAAINLAEEAIASGETADSLRSQIKDFVEEASRVKAENAELKREMARLKKGETPSDA